MLTADHSPEGFGITPWAEPPDPDNENLVLSEVMTPAEVLQWVRREKARLAQAVAADPSLWSCPEHRRTWAARLGIEQIARRLIDGGHKG